MLKIFKRKLLDIRDGFDKFKGVIGNSILVLTNKTYKYDDGINYVKSLLSNVNAKYNSIEINIQRSLCDGYVIYFSDYNSYVEFYKTYHSSDENNIKVLPYLSFTQPDFYYHSIIIPRILQAYCPNNSLNIARFISQTFIDKNIETINSSSRTCFLYFESEQDLFKVLFLSGLSTSQINSKMKTSYKIYFNRVRFVIKKSSSYIYPNEFRVKYSADLSILKEIKTHSIKENKPKNEFIVKISDIDSYLSLHKIMIRQRNDDQISYNYHFCDNLNVCKSALIVSNIPSEFNDTRNAINLLELYHKNVELLRIGDKPVLYVKCNRNEFFEILMKNGLKVYNHEIQISYFNDISVDYTSNVYIIKNLPRKFHPNSSLKLEGSILQLGFSDDFMYYQNVPDVLPSFPCIVDNSLITFSHPSIDTIIYYSVPNIFVSQTPMNISKEDLDQFFYPDSVSSIYKTRDLVSSLNQFYFVFDRNYYSLECIKRRNGAFLDLERIHFNELSAPFLKENGNMVLRVNELLLCSNSNKFGFLSKNKHLIGIWRQDSYFNKYYNQFHYRVCFRSIKYLLNFLYISPAIAAEYSIFPTFVYQKYNDKFNFTRVILKNFPLYVTENEVRNFCENCNFDIVRRIVDGVNSHILIEIVSDPYHPIFFLNGKNFNLHTIVVEYASELSDNIYNPYI